MFGCVRTSVAAAHDSASFLRGSSAMEGCISGLYTRYDGTFTATLDFQAHRDRQAKVKVAEREELGKKIIATCEK